MVVNDEHLSVREGGRRRGGGEEGREEREGEGGKGGREGGEGGRGRKGREGGRETERDREIGKLQVDESN